MMTEIKKVLPWQKKITVKSSPRYAEWTLKHGGAHWHLTVCYTGSMLDKQGRAVTLRKNGERVGDFSREKRADGALETVSAYIRKVLEPTPPAPPAPPKKLTWRAPYYLVSLLRDEQAYAKKGYTLVTMREPSDPRDITVMDIVLNKYLGVEIGAKRPTFDAETEEVLRRIELCQQGRFRDAFWGYPNITLQLRFITTGVTGGLKPYTIATAAQQAVAKIEYDPYMGPAYDRDGW